MSTRLSARFICARCQWRLDRIALTSGPRRPWPVSIPTRLNSTATGDAGQPPAPHAHDETPTTFKPDSVDSRAYDNARESPVTGFENVDDGATDVWSEDADRSRARNDRAGRRNSYASREKKKSAESEPPSFRRLRVAHRTYKSKGQKLEAEREPLSMDMLGKPAHAIVVRDKGRVPTIPTRVGEEVTQDVEALNSGTSLANTVSEEKLRATEEEAHRNLDELCPGLDSSLPRQEFDALMQKLVAGFTSSQLVSYTKSRRTRKSRNPVEVQTIRGVVDYEYQPWMPYVTDESQESTNPQFLGYIKPGLGVKDRRALYIMRNIWNVSMQEVHASFGSVIVQLDDVAFQLLYANKDQWLLPLQESLLQEGSQIDLEEQTKAIEILAPKAVAESVLSSVADALRSVATVHLDISALTTAKLSDKTLDMLGKITQTQVAPLGRTPAKLRVTSMKSPGQDDTPAELESDLETKADVLYRLLLTADPGATEVASRTVVHPRDAVGSHVVLDDALSKRSWDSRLGDWGRWLAPTASLSISTSRERKAAFKPATKPLPASVLRYPVVATSMPSTASQHDTVSIFEEPLEPATGQPYGWGGSTRLTRALFGHVLHPFSAPETHGVMQQVSEPPTAGKKIFTPITPPLSRLAFPASGLTELDDSTVVMHFLPDPASARRLKAGPGPGPGPGPALPLQLSLNLAQDGRHRVNHVRAITAHDTVDLLQPSHPVDVRITQQSHTDLLGQRAVDRHAAPLADFLRRSHLSLAAGQLRTPPRVTGLALPYRALARTTSSATSGDDADRLVLVDYIFAGLELLYTTQTNYDGWLLRYSIIEGGKSRGSRAELSLESIIPSEGGVDEHEAQLASSANSQHFLSAASKLAHDPGFWLS